ncbi:S-adenosyl-L-methionine-dependent methyltransferases superfamily protein [Rhynchospora pubera]|uniref:S-adenosyl-L-methionine-dependent methyltransferases superfamily protein n=1 Tax=Rhynchospora pubera TaxID=906938 RepID=A0AAV8F892_9POAL|nr:S-adenosyl-L-methionine-dependent methyltransferases superfamily protein [Rhynchospora pubera]
MRGPRNDSRKNSSSYCSGITIVLFVALSLIGVWMLTSATVVPVEFSLADSNRSENKDNKLPADSGLDLSKGNSDNKQEEYKEKPVQQPQEEPNLNKDQDFLNSNSNNFETEPTKEGGNNKDPNSVERINDELGSESTKKDDKSEEKKQEIEENSPDGTDSILNNSTEEKNFEKTNDDQEPENTKEEKKSEEAGEEVKEYLPDGAQAELLNETSTQTGSWSTQDAESKNEKEKIQGSNSNSLTIPKKEFSHSWKLCNATAGADYIPCLDNEKAIKKLRSTKHYEHRERHCPESGSTCLVALPNGYRSPIKWPISRDKIWYANVPHTQLVQYKGHQNWLKVSGEYLTFPGGGTQFKHGVTHYIDVIQEAYSNIAWGKRTRVILDVGCGVASFGGYLFDKDVLTMSFAPKDEHEAQVQFALERGIPAISAVMGTKRLPFPSAVFDAIHCARCRVPWHIEGGKLLLELNRLLRPGGYFIWSATPVYQKLPEDVEIWKAMSALTKSMCWNMVNRTKDKVNRVGVAIFKKPTDNSCYETRMEVDPPLCEDTDDPDASWNVPLQTCMHKVPVDSTVHGTQWPQEWPQRLVEVPYWLKGSSRIGVYGKQASDDFQSDYEHWSRVVSKSYQNGLGIDWSTVRNVMDMRAVYGGFAAALRNMQVWVMNVVTTDSPDTLPIIYERGLFGLYHDWCESFSTYPRTYDLLHADHLFSKLKPRCDLLPVITEVDRILRPGGKLIVRDKLETIGELEAMARSLNWEVRMTYYAKDTEGLLCVQKTMWRPSEYEAKM